MSKGYVWVVDDDSSIRWVMEKTGDQWSFIKVALALAVAAAGSGQRIWLCPEK